MRKDAVLHGVSDRAAIRLYEGAKAILRERGQWNAATQAQLASAAQWTEEINALSDAIRKGRARNDEDGKAESRRRSLMRSKALADGERRKIFDDLNLLPRKPRGRPPQEGDEELPADDGWDSFDDSPGDDGA